MSLSGRGYEGTGAELEVAVGVSGVTSEGFLRSGRDEKIAAVAAAPVAAEMPAMMARVVLDIVNVCRLEILEKQRMFTTYKVTTTATTTSTRYTQSSGLLPFGTGRVTRVDGGSDVPGCIN